MITPRFATHSRRRGRSTASLSTTLKSSISLGIVKTGARGVSYLSVHLRFGTISIREPWKMSLEEQRAAAVSLGLGYPSPIVDHEGPGNERWNSTGRSERVDRPWPK
jgi:deoxyribodipyrimidine photolyase